VLFREHPATWDSNGAVMFDEHNFIAVYEWSNQILRTRGGEKGKSKGKKKKKGASKGGKGEGEPDTQKTIRLGRELKILPTLVPN